MKSLVTGATGFVGSHIVEKLIAQGCDVIAFARKSSDTTFLESLGIEIRYGSLTDPASVYTNMKGIDRVYHAAAMTEEWIPQKISRNVNVTGTANLLEASLENHIERFFHISSLAVMGIKNHYGTGVDTNYPKAHDPYIDTKIEAEKLAWRFHRFGLPVTVLRPGFMYGPRDRRFMKRILDKLRTGQFIFIGDGKNKLNLNYAGNFADAVALAGLTQDSIGQAYNIANDDKTLDMQKFISKVADLWGYPLPQKHIPVPIAKTATILMENTARMLRNNQPPLLTKTRLKFLSLNLEFDISKAKTELGFENKIGIDQGLSITKQWIETTHAYDETKDENVKEAKVHLPFTYRDKMTVESEEYRKQVRNEIQQLKEMQGYEEDIIRLESILNHVHTSSDHFEIGHFTASDGQVIQFNKWKCNNPQHVIIYLNGLESHAGWFSYTAAQLEKNDIEVYGLDRRGSGINSRTIGTYHDWINDVGYLSEIIKKDNPHARLHLASLCLGAVTATASAIMHQERFDSLIYISPGLNVKVDPTPGEKLLIALDTLPGLTFNIRSPIRKDEMFTDSREALYYLYKDKLRTFSPRASDFMQIKKMRSYVFANLDRITIPSIAFFAETDQVVDKTVTKRNLRMFTTAPQITEYEDSRHALLLGDSKDKLIADITAFLQPPSPAQEALMSEAKPIGTT